MDPNVSGDANGGAGLAGARAVAPVPVDKNTPPTFYRGAGRIDAFRGLGPAGADRPEDWIASTVTRLGEQVAGLTVLADGTVLRDLVRADPAAWLGRADLEDPALELPLVKLLDAGERLPVHLHPSDAQALALGVGSHGKAEAWCVLDAPADGAVHLGWTRDVERAELVDWVVRQDVAAMLGAMHVLTVVAGDTVYVPPGMPHAIGEGIFLVEVQQAADLSVLLEWTGFFDDDSGAFLGVDRDAALACTDLRGRSVADAQALVTRGALDGPPGTRLLPVESETYFSADLVGAGATLPAAYRTLVVLTGGGRLVRPDAPSDPGTAVARGTTLAVPAAAGPLVLIGSADLTALAFGPGEPEHRTA